MEEDHGGVLHSLPPFLAKTYEMVDEARTDSIVSWSSSEKSFVVRNSPEFARVLLPKFFKHNNFSSFIRQLNTYGFKKVDPEQWEFANDYFIRGKPHLMKNIHRRKPVHSHSPQNLQIRGAPQQMIESERQSLKEEIERLQHETHELASESQRHESDWRAFETQKRDVKERIRVTEERQNQIVSILTQALQKRGHSVCIMSQLEAQARKRRTPEIGFLYDGVGPNNSLIVSSESLPDSDSNLNLDQLEHFEASLAFWEGLIQDFSQSRIQADESTGCDESPPISCVHPNTETRPKSPGIDVNSDPATTEPPRVPTGVNDMFWEQFLTENPGSSNAQEAQSERKDSENRRSESVPGDTVKFWWNRRNVTNITEQMGHLTPAERT